MIEVDVEIDSISVDVEMAGEVPSSVITPSGIAYLFNEFSGQTDEYTPGDDGWHFQNGTYAPNNPPYPEYYALLDLNAADPFVTLVNNNIFGNKNRFTDTLGGQVYADNIVRDHLIRRDIYGILQTGNWPDAHSATHLQTIAGHNDWRVLNDRVYDSIMSYDASLGDPIVYPPFSNIFNSAGWTNLWTSTTRVDLVTDAYFYQTRFAGRFLHASKSIVQSYLICRTF